MKPTEPAGQTAPYVFLDVDGVLNALTAPLDAHDHRMLTVSSVEYPIHIRHAVLDWLRTLGERADVRWATTWQDHANEVLGPAFGLPPFPVACRDVDEHGQSSRSGLWKFDGILRTITVDPRPFVWVDDEAIPVRIDFLLETHDVPYLCLEPHGDLGLTDDQMVEIDDFLHRHR